MPSLCPPDARSLCLCVPLCLCLCLCRFMGFEKGEDYKKTWKSSEDGKVNSNQPMRMEDNRDGGSMPSSYITRWAWVPSPCHTALGFLLIWRGSG